MGELVDKHSQKEAEGNDRPEDPRHPPCGDQGRVDRYVKNFLEHIGGRPDLASDNKRKERDNQNEGIMKKNRDVKKPPDPKRSIHKVWIIFLTHMVYTFI